jgi:hypothetical protein
MSSVRCKAIAIPTSTCDASVCDTLLGYSIGGGLGVDEAKEIFGLRFLPDRRFATRRSLMNDRPPEPG